MEVEDPSTSFFAGMHFAPIIAQGSKDFPADRNTRAFGKPRPTS